MIHTPYLTPIYGEITHFYPSSLYDPHFLKYRHGYHFIGRKLPNKLLPPTQREHTHTHTHTHTQNTTHISEGQSTGAVQGLILQHGHARGRGRRGELGTGTTHLHHTQTTLLVHLSEEKKEKKRKDRGGKGQSEKQVFRGKKDLKMSVLVVTVLALHHLY